MDSAELFVSQCTRSLHDFPTACRAINVVMLCRAIALATYNMGVAGLLVAAVFWADADAQVRLLHPWGLEQGWENICRGC